MLVLKRMSKTDPLPFEPCSWSTGTDAEIANALKKHYANEIDLTEYWGIGDERVIHLKAMDASSPTHGTTLPEQDITVVIVAHNHTDLDEPINGHNKAVITVQTKECLHNNSSDHGQVGHVYLNGTGSTIDTFTSWNDLYIQDYLWTTVFEAFPNTFKSSIKRSVNNRRSAYTGTTSYESKSFLFLPSYPEVFGTTSNSYYSPTNPTEGTQFTYYSNAYGGNVNKIKYGNNNGLPNEVIQDWWLSSPSSRYDSSLGYTWFMVDSANMTPSAEPTWGGYSAALAPAWAM